MVLARRGSGANHVSALEPMVAHGSRMSWAGLLRPGDNFTPARKSQRAVMKVEHGQALRRYFGTWSDRYRRFTTNLDSAKITVTALEPGQSGDGIPCILHWVNRNDMIRSDEGSVCAGDGWPRELWDTFTSQLACLDGMYISEKLRSFLESDVKEDDALIRGWRHLLRSGEAARGRVTETSALDLGWLPVPAPLTVDGGTATACIVSWAPSAPFHSSLSSALASLSGARGAPDPRSQARYYVECVLVSCLRG